MTDLTLSTETRPDALPDAPYVGLRPYEPSERAIFFGRSNEATVLVNKILTNPLTVVFAPSGVGKTSIFRTLIIPELRGLEARVSYLDNWRLDPVSALTEALRSEAGESGAEALSLVELACSANQRFNESVVLVLDQFEQLLLRQDASTSLAEQLGALMRSSADAHIVIVLREEYLALLHTLRGHWLTVTASRYRLGALSRAGAREAIERPLAAFSGSIEESLIEELLRTLERGSSAIGVGEDFGQLRSISLPVLQIVCNRLWAAAAQTPERRMSMEIYQRDGECHGVVEAYVRDVLSGVRPEDRLSIARVLNLLAPRAGIKMAYPIDLLGYQLELPRDWLVAQLEQFAERRIVQFREDGEVAELTHDAFTEVLRPFIEQELQAAKTEQLARELVKKRRQRRVRLLALIVLTLAAVVFGTGSELLRQQEDQRAALSGEDCGRLLSAVRYFHDRASGRYPWLERPLSVFARPASRELLDGLRNSQAAAACNAPQHLPRNLSLSRPEAGVTLVFHDDGAGTAPARIKPEAVRRLWRRFSEDLWEGKKIRLSPRVDVTFDDAVDADTFVVKIGDRPMLVLPTRASDHPDEQQRVALLIRRSPEAIEEAIELFFKEGEYARRELFGLEERTVMLGFAPGWTTPLWRSIEERIAPAERSTELAFSVEVWPAREARLALDAVEAISRHPELYLPEGVTQELLARRAKKEPCLVAAAAHLEGCAPVTSSGAHGVAACIRDRGRRLVARAHQSLVQAAHGSRSSGVLSRVLDRLADVSLDDAEADPVHVAEWVLKDPPRTSLGSLQLTGKADWSCPNPFGSADGAPDEERARGPSGVDDVARMLNDEDTPIRITMGTDLVAGLADRASSPRWVRENFRQVEVELYRSFGIVLPEPVVTRGDWSERRFEVRLMTAPEASYPAPELEVIPRTVGELLRNDPADWVSVDDRWVLPAHLTRWIEERWSRNDVKQLLRAVLRGGPAHTVERRVDVGWLLGTLPVWSTVCAPRDGACLAAGLLETQAARTKTHPVAAAEWADDVVASIFHDRPEDVRQKLERAEQRIGKTAFREFLTAYVAARSESLVSRANNACEVPAPAEAWKPITKAALLQAEVALEQLDASDVRRAALEYCITVRALPSEDAGADVKPLEDLARAEQDWTPAQKFWFAYHLQNAQLALLSKDGRAAVPRDVAETIRRLLTEGLQPESSKRDPAIALLRDSCKAHRNDTCLWDLAEVALQLPLSRSSFWGIAWDLRLLDTYGAAERVEIVTRLWRRVEAELSEDQAAALAFFRLRLGLDALDHGQGDPNAVAAALGRLQLEEARLGRKASREARQAYRTALEYAGRAREAGDVGAELLRTASGGLDEQTAAVGLLIERGEVEEAARQADVLLERGPSDPDVLFLSAIAHLLLNDDVARQRAERLLFWFDHPNADYVRLMLAWHLRRKDDEAAATELLEQRLRSAASRDAPERRLAVGDLNPWREMLIRYYLDPSEERRRSIFDPLEDEETFARSPLVGGAQSYSAFHCEALFYDALLQSVVGEAGSRRRRYAAGLEQVSNERCFEKLEPDMARWLRARPEEEKRAELR